MMNIVVEGFGDLKAGATITVIKMLISTGFSFLIVVNFFLHVCGKSLPLWDEKSFNIETLVAFINHVFFFWWFMVLIIVIRCKWSTIKRRLLAI